MGAPGGAIRRGIRVDRAAFEGVPRLVIGAGLDSEVPDKSSERLAEWLDAHRTNRSGPLPLWARPRRGRATSRSPTRSGHSSRRTASSDGRSGPVWYHPPSRRHARGPCRIRLEAQDTALSRRRSSVRIRYAVPLPIRQAPRHRGRFPFPALPVHDRHRSASPRHPYGGPVPGLTTPRRRWASSATARTRSSPSSIRRSRGGTSANGCRGTFTSGGRDPRRGAGMPARRDTAS